jgi:hypothetical protein
MTPSAIVDSRTTALEILSLSFTHRGYMAIHFHGVLFRMVLGR